MTATYKCFRVYFDGDQVYVNFSAYKPGFTDGWFTLLLSDPEFSTKFRDKYIEISNKWNELLGPPAHKFTY